MINVINKTKLFTHTDLDGVSCAVLLKCLSDDIDVEYCSYDNINSRVSTFLEKEEYKTYDSIFITDISVNEEVASAIEKLDIHNLILLDHHNTAKYLNKYPWALVNDKAFGKLTCGTDLLYSTLKSIDLIDRNNDYLNMYVDIVRRWDTWVWKEHPDVGQISKDMNTLFRSLGIDDFVDWAVNKIKDNPDIRSIYEIFDISDKMIIRIINKKEEYYVNRTIEHAKLIDFKGYRAALMTAEEQTSNICDKLLTENKDVDIAIVINFSINVCSFRTQRDDINVGLIAKEYGGGGHPKAAAFSIDLTYKDNFLFTALGPNFRRYLEDDEYKC